MARANLDQAKREWLAGHEGFYLLNHDLATWLNNRFEYGVAESHARSAMQIALGTRGKASLLYAIAAQNLAVAVASQQRFAEADDLLRSAYAVLAMHDDAKSMAYRLNALLAMSGLEFARAQPKGGLEKAEQAARLLAHYHDFAPRLRAQAELSIAEARRKMLRLDEASAMLDKADLSIEAARGSISKKRLWLGRSRIAFERSDLESAFKLLENAESAVDDACDPLADGDVMYFRASLHMVRREVPEASAEFSRALASFAKAGLGENPRQAEITYGLAVAAGMARDYVQATKLFDSAAVMFRRSFGRPSEQEALTHVEKSQMLASAGDGQKSLQSAILARKVLDDVTEQSPMAKPYAQVVLGLAHQRNRDFVRAKREIGGALKSFERERGADSFDLAPGLNALGEIAIVEGNPTNAAAHFTRAVTIQRRWGGESALALGMSLSKLANARQLLGLEAIARQDSAEAVNVLRRRLAVGEARPWADAEIERQAGRSILDQDLKLMTSGLSHLDSRDDRSSVERIFDVAQMASATRTGAAVSQMTSRIAQLDTEIGKLLRERNDLSAEWRSTQAEVLGLLGADAPRLDQDRRLDLLRRQEKIAKRLADLDVILTSKSPKLDLVIKSKTVDLAALWRALKPNEAALVITVSDEAAYVIAISPDKAVVHRSPLTKAELNRDVTLLRSALDRTRWRFELPPLDADAAHRLFTGLILPVMPALSSADTLLIVPDAPLSSLPFSVLLTERVDAIRGNPEDYTVLPWLLRRFAIATYPSAASIVALRGITRDRENAQTFLGIGDPEFSGDQAVQTRGGDFSTGRSRSSLANVTLLRKLARLPETREELVAMARAMGQTQSRLVLGQEATETVVRSASLKNYRTIAFATHGLVAGELSGYEEPGLVLTPPAEATMENDGMLSASEIALLDIQSDWVILSACNTAASDGRAAAEPLSGLARAFFYAGARALMVTHWQVDSPATAKFTSHAVAQSSRGLSPAMALRDAALDFIEDRDSSLRTHPYFWAQFNLIGG